jgi:hypothetical protein
VRNHTQQFINLPLLVNKSGRISSVKDAPEVTLKQKRAASLEKQAQPLAV